LGLPGNKTRLSSTCFVTLAQEHCTMMVSTVRWWWALYDDGEHCTMMVSTVLWWCTCMETTFVQPHDLKVCARQRDLT